MSDVVPTTAPFLTGKLYDQLKFCAQVLFPGIGTLYFALAGIWGLPDAQAVVGTIVAVDLFLGLLLGLSTASYNKSDAGLDGHVTVVPDAEAGTSDLHLSLDPAALESGQKKVTLKVNRS